MSLRLRVLAVVLVMASISAACSKGSTASRAVETPRWSLSVCPSLRQDSCAGAHYEDLEYERSILENAYRSYHFGALGEAATPYADDHRKAAEAAEAEFLQYRERQCEAVGIEFGAATSAGLEVLLCEIELTDGRIAYLDSRLVPPWDVRPSTLE